jgi:membrane protease YdiL (CAAX protease family)
MTTTNEAKTSVAPWWHTALVLLPFLVGSAVSAHQHTLEHVNLPGMSARLSGYLTLLVEEWLAVLLVWLQAKRGGLSIGELVSGEWRNVTAFLKDLGLAIGFLVIGVPLLSLMARFIGTDASEISYTPKTALEAVIWVGVAATAGFAEELIFRGYLTKQLEGWTNSVALAVVIQGLLFGLAHGYYSRSMLAVAVYGVLLGLFAWWRKSLRPGMLAHGLQDGILGLLTFFFVK